MAKINKSGSYNPAQRGNSAGGRMMAPVSNPASKDRDSRTNHKILKATAAAPMAFDGAPTSFDSGGKRPRNKS